MNELVWVSIVAIFVLGFVYLQERAARRKVIEYLERKGCEDVIVHTKMFGGGGRGSISFDVEYADRKGNVRKNSCVVHTGLFSKETIYWKKPLGDINQLNYDRDPEDFNLWSG